MFEPGEVIPYFEMCREEGSSLQRGMNYRLGGGDSVVLMSRRPGAPYADRVEEDGRVLIYEGHDAVRRVGEPGPKTLDQPLTADTGGATQNAEFFSAAKRHATRGARHLGLQRHLSARQRLGGGEQRPADLQVPARARPRSFSLFASTSSSL